MHAILSFGLPPSQAITRWRRTTRDVSPTSSSQLREADLDGIGPARVDNELRSVHLRDRQVQNTVGSPESSFIERVSAPPDAVRRQAARREPGQVQLRGQLARARPDRRSAPDPRPALPPAPRPSPGPVNPAGGSSGPATAWTLRSLLVKLPLDSPGAARGTTTWASSVVSVGTVSATIRKSRPASDSRTRSGSAAPDTGSSPMMSAARMEPAATPRASLADSRASPDVRKTLPVGARAGEEHQRHRPGRGRNHGQRNGEGRVALGDRGVERSRIRRRGPLCPRRRARPAASSSVPACYGGARGRRRRQLAERIETSHRERRVLEGQPHRRVHVRPAPGARSKARSARPVSRCAPTSTSWSLPERQRSVGPRS